MPLLRPGRTDAAEAIITADARGRIVFWSHGAERVFGYAQTEIIGQALTVLMPEHYRAGHEAGIARVQRERVSRLQRQTLRLEGLRKNGEAFPMNLTLSSWFFADEIYFTGIIRDLTETHEALQLHQDIYFDVTTILAASPTFDDAASSLLRVLSEGMGWVAATLWLVDGDVLRCARFWSAPDLDVDEFRRVTESMTPTVGVGLPGRVWADSQPAWVADTAEDPNFPRHTAANHAGFRSAVAFPILVGREFGGVMEFFGTTVRAPDESLLKLMTYIGSQIGLFLGRERVEEALRASESRYRVLFEKSEAGVYRTTLDGRILEVNQALAEIFGYATPQELIGRSVKELYANTEERQKIVDRVGAGERIVSVEVQGRRKDGSTIWFLLNIGAIDDVVLKLPIIHGTVIDITARKATEAKLARVTKSLSRAQELASVGSFEADFVTGLATWSDQMYRITGLEPQAIPITLEYAMSLVVDEDRQRVRESLVAAARARRPIDLNYTTRRPNGELRLIRMHAQLELSESGAPSQVVGTIQDITEEQQMIADGERLRRQIEQVRRVSSLGSLAASMAHEFNNVLMGIQPHVEVIRRSVPSSATLDRSLQHVVASVKRGRRITEEILTFARPIPLDMKPVDIDELIDHVTNLKFPGIAIEVVRPPGEIHVLGDAAQLQQVLTNLAVNARDAMPEGGLLRVTIELTSELNNEPTVVINVYDTGTGMTPDVQEHIFEPLFTTKKSGGTGLGLAITHQIILAHGGTVAVSSAVGEGTIFRLSLRRADALARPAAVETAVRPRLDGVRRVLLIEDEQAVSEGLTAALHGFGIETTVLSHGMGAARYVGQHLPDAVVLDIGLPDISGWDVLTELQRKFPALPVVISSGHAVVPDGHESTSIIVRKPYAIEELIEALAKAVNHG